MPPKSGWFGEQHRCGWNNKKGTYIQASNKPTYKPHKPWAFRWIDEIVLWWTFNDVLGLTTSQLTTWSHFSTLSFYSSVLSGQESKLHQQFTNFATSICNFLCPGASPLPREDTCMLPILHSPQEYLTSSKNEGCVELGASISSVEWSPWSIWDFAGCRAYQTLWGGTRPAETQRSSLSATVFVRVSSPDRQLPQSGAVCWLIWD